MGHSVGLGDNYYRIPEKELLAEYSKAVSDLSVSNSPQVMDETRMKSVEDDMASLKVIIYDMLVALKKDGKVIPDDVQERIASLNKHFKVGKTGSIIVNVGERRPKLLFY
jgi:hypothetical protein